VKKTERRGGKKVNNMNPFIIILVTTQIFFTTSDLIARHNMAKYGFTLSTFISSWFLIYFLIRTTAMFGQLYVFTNIQLGKTMALFGATSIILSNILGLLLLKEVLSPVNYLGVSLAVIAFLVLAIRI
jgi:drug/metabolite transporter (DMT)-like permease